MRYLDFGCEINFQSVKVDATGQLGTLTRQPIDTAPYFQLADRPAGAAGEAKARSEVSHFLVQPFPGHEWNHLLVYFLQDRPIHVARMVAHGLGEAPPEEMTVRAEAAPSDVCERSLRRLAGFREAYVDVLDGETVTRFYDACDEWIGPEAFVAGWRADPPPDSAPPPDDRPTGARSLRQNLDFTYLHVSFAAEAMLLLLDVYLLARTGTDPGQYVSEQAMQDPLFLRLGNMSAASMTQFLRTWHRQRYAQFDEFTARFVSSLDTLRLSKTGLSV